MKNEDASRYARSKPPVFVRSVAATGCIILTVVVFNSPLNAQKDSADVDRRELARREQTNESQKNEAVEAIERELSKINAQLRATVSDDGRSKLTQLRGRMLRRLSEMEEHARDPERLRQQLRDEPETINRQEPRVRRDNQGNEPPSVQLATRMSRLLAGIKELKSALNRQGISPKAREEFERRRVEIRNEAERLHKEFSERRAPQVNRERSPAENERSIDEIEYQKRALHASLQEIEAALERNEFTPAKREELQRKRRELQQAVERLHHQSIHEHEQDPASTDDHGHDHEHGDHHEDGDPHGGIERRIKGLHARVQELGDLLERRDFHPEKREELRRERRELQGEIERLHNEYAQLHEPEHTQSDHHDAMERQIEETQNRVQELGAVLEQRNLSPEKREALMRERRDLQRELERLHDEFAHIHEHESDHSESQRSERGWHEQEEIERRWEFEERAERQTHRRNTEGREDQEREREHAHDRERELQEQEVHLRHLEIDMRQLEMQAAHREAAAQSAQLADNKLASLSMAIQRASEFLGENEAREFLNDLLEQTRNPQVARLLRHELVRLSFQVEDHDAVRHHLRSLILERD